MAQVQPDKKKIQNNKYEILKILKKKKQSLKDGFIIKGVQKDNSGALTGIKIGGHLFT